MRTLLPLVIAAITTAGIASQPVSDEEIERVAAFARLYGVARYFYPSDAAAALDWDRFAVHGVARVRAAADTRSLETALTDLFSPLGPGLVVGTDLPRPSVSGGAGDRLVAWRYFGPGLAAQGGGGPYRRQRTNRSAPEVDGFVTMMQFIPAQDLRGRSIRLRGMIRAVASDGGGAALWLRVDRPDRGVGFFNNMGDRPVREAEWREYTIEGTVAEDATQIAFGVMASGPVTADFDRIDLAVRGADGAWDPVEIRDPGFEEPDGQPAGWFRTGTSKTAAMTRPSGDAPEGRQYLRFAPQAAGSAAAGDLFEGAAPSAGAHVDVDLGAGLTARIPLALSDADAAIDSARADRLQALHQSLASIPKIDGDPVLDVRLADVVVAWNVFRHFYPYWPETGVDWDAHLRPHLRGAYSATTREHQRNALRRLVADAQDGHGNVLDGPVAEPVFLPLQLAVLEGRLVVTASDAPAGVPVGAEVRAIDGVPAAQRLAEEMALASGTTQWKQVRAIQEITRCRNGTVVQLVVENGTRERQLGLPCESARRPVESRPDPIVEISPGIWYADLTRATMAQLRPTLDNLARAAAVVFDVRGYPTDAGAGILPHLFASAEDDRWMHVARITGPFGQSAGWHSVGWNVQPASPYFAGRVVFMTDGRAISYAESVMGYVADRKLGTIVGSTTAGTNGNVVSFGVPGGFRVMFTGMRVTRHDGVTPFHLIGVSPDVPVEPTIASVREGSDLVLQRALEIAMSDR